MLTLDRIEGNFAVLIDENGSKTDVPVSLLPVLRTGSVYEKENDVYIYNEKETEKRRNAVAERTNRLFSHK